MKSVKLLTAALLLSCGPQRLTAMSLNIACGADDHWFDTKAARIKQADFIDDHIADIVGMQEVDYFVRRSGRVHTGTESVGKTIIREQWDADHTALTTTFRDGSHLVFGPSFTFDADFCDVLDGSPCDVSGDARMGNAIYLAPGLDIKSALVLKFPAGGERRSLLAVVLSRPQLLIINTHLSVWPADSRVPEFGAVSALVTAFRVAGYPVLALGDWNAYGDEVGSFLIPAGLGRYSSPGDEKVVDQVWGSPELKTVHNYLWPTAGASDHPFAAGAMFTLGDK